MLNFVCMLLDNTAKCIPLCINNRNILLLFYLILTRFKVQRQEVSNTSNILSTDNPTHRYWKCVMIDHKKKYEVKQHIQSCVWIQSLSNTVKMNCTVRKWFVLAASCTLLSALFLFSFDVYVNNPGDYMYVYSNNRIINYTAKGPFDGSRKDVFQNMMRNVSGYLDRLSLDELSIHSLAISHVTRRYPTIVMAASSNHFRESMALLVNLNCTIRRKFPGIELIYFDIGLLSSQRKEVKRYCNCTFVKFPFRQFPDHVYNVKNFAWKPLIIQLTMKKHPFVLYLDASVRFHH